MAVRFAGFVGGDVSEPAWVVITSCGRFAASRDWKSTPSVEVPARTRSKVPFPVTSEVTSNVAQVDVAIDVTFPTPEPLSAGLFAHVIAGSDHVLAVVNTDGPFAVGLVAQSRSDALWIVPVTPVTVNRRYVWTSGSAPPSTRSAVEVPNAVVGLTSVTSASATGVNVCVAARAGTATPTTTATPASTRSRAIEAAGTTHGRPRPPRRDRAGTHGDEPPRYHPTLPSQARVRRRHPPRSCAQESIGTDAVREVAMA